MDKPVRSRPVIALLAAYVLALQTLLLPLSVATKVPLDNHLCATSSEISQGPAGHDIGYPCAPGCGMPCCAQALNVALQAIIVGPTQAYALRLAAAIEPAVRPAAKGPQIPRAPPV